MQASTIRDSLKQARLQAESMDGIDLTLRDQQHIIAVLEQELKKRRSDTSAG